jgi:hypothetical protein
MFVSLHFIAYTVLSYKVKKNILREYFGDSPTSRLSALHSLYFLAFDQLRIGSRVARFFFIYCTKTRGNLPNGH